MNTAVMAIQIERKSARFKSHWYPVCKAAKLFAQLSGNTTLTDDVILKLHDVGIIAEDVTPNQLSVLLREEA